ncbi:ABC transporter permease (plasmid) [Agrobacterium vitis]|uniref:ABC transporter permease n=1 Tax=Agrobacterium vitis TaxID=373 RepID=UPI001F463CFE|nr:ABC transporter permease [Agrobacterium vitis]
MAPKPAPVALWHRYRAPLAQVAIPAGALLIFLVLWQWYVREAAVPLYILPAPTDVAASLYNDWGILSAALLITLKITFSALAAALAGGVLFAILFAESRFLELIFYPYAVVLQVTPIVAVAPLIIIYVQQTELVLLLCAFLVAFFPILSNTTQGLKSADHNLLNLFEMYGANRWQRLRLLLIPGALPYFTIGLRIGGGLALIGAIVAEFTAGAAGEKAGLAFRILEAGRRLNVPRLFAALLLITFTGVVIFALTSLISHLLLRKWHESALKREN